MISQIFNAVRRNTLGRLHQEYFVKQPQALLKRVSTMPAEQAPLLVLAEFAQAQKRIARVENRAMACIGGAMVGVLGLSVGDLMVAPALINTAAAIGVQLPVVPVVQAVALGSVVGCFGSLAASLFQLYPKHSALMQREIARDFARMGKEAPQEAGDLHADVARRKEYLAFHQRTCDFPL